MGQGQISKGLGHQPEELSSILRKPMEGGEKMLAVTRGKGVGEDKTEGQSGRSAGRDPREGRGRHPDKAQGAHLRTGEAVGPP